MDELGPICIKSGPVYWNRSGGAGPCLYNWSDENGSVLQAWHFNGSTFDPSCAVSQATIPSPAAHAGGVLTVSASGGTPNTGIVWASMPLSSDGENGAQQGVLRAFNADNLSQELWDSNVNAARDAMGYWPKFSPPTVANGRVYMASLPSDGMGTGYVVVYGLLNTTYPPAVGEVMAPVLQLLLLN